MISGGAAFLFALIALVAGIVIGQLIPRPARDTDEVAGEWGEIDRAATAAYHGAAADIAEHRRMTIDEAAAAIGRAPRTTETRRPWIVLTCNGIDPEKPYVVDERGFEALVGAPMRDVLAALGRARR